MKFHVPLSTTFPPPFIPVIPAIKTSANRVLNDMGELRLHETLHRRADTALSAISDLLAELRGERRAHLTSPARVQARVQARGPDHLMALSKSDHRSLNNVSHLSVNK